jgi:hypothetical protein
MAGCVACHLYAQARRASDITIGSAPVEHAITTKIAANARAAALHKQLMVLLC